MAETWSVMVMFEGPAAEAKVRSLIDQAMRDPEVHFVTGGPGITNWDIGDVGPGWETHNYDRGRAVARGEAP